MQLTSTALFAKSNLDLSNKLQQTILLDNEINGFAAEYDQLGISISVDGNLAAVGATEAKTHGVVYLFEYDGTGWHNIGYVEPSDGFYDDKFGQSVSLKGNTLVVGSYHNNYLQQNGAVYVFEWMNNQWNQIQKITTNHPNISTRYESHFGYTVNLYQDWIFVAATNDDSLDGNHIDSGAVYIYKNNNGYWDFNQRLEANINIYEAHFGASIDVDNNTAMIGALKNDLTGIQDNNVFGVVYAYTLENDTWIYDQYIFPNEHISNDLFGATISLEGNRMVVGAATAFTDGLTGAAFVFEKIDNIWTQTQRLIANDASVGAFFGTHVHLSGDQVIIGSYKDSTQISESGSAYIFILDDNTWLQSAKLYPDQMTNTGRFGLTTYIDKSKALVGGYRQFGVTFSSGAISSFTSTNKAWTTATQLEVNKGVYKRHLGTGVSINDTSILIGMPFIENSEESAAIYYELEAENWIQKYKIKPDEPITNRGYFGETLTHNENLMVIGAPTRYGQGQADNRGKAYVFEKDNEDWIQIAILEPLSETEIYFGKTVIISNNRILVGSSKNAYIYEKVNNVWTQTSQLVPDNTRSFSAAYAIDGNYIVAIDNGVILYEFINDEWIEIASYFPQIFHIEEVFGKSVDLKDNRIIVGAPYNLNNTSGFTGAVYIFEYNQADIIQTHKFLPNTHSYSNFGLSVKLQQDRAIIGSPELVANAVGDGRIFIYDLIGESWIKQNEIENQQGHELDNFGISISATETLLLTGLPRSDYQGSESGSAKVFAIPDTEVIFYNGFE